MIHYLLSLITDKWRVKKALEQPKKEDFRALVGFLLLMGVAGVVCDTILYFPPGVGDFIFILLAGILRAVALMLLGFMTFIIAAAVDHTFLKCNQKSTTYEACFNVNLYAIGAFMAFNLVEHWGALFWIFYVILLCLWVHIRAKWLIKARGVSENAYVGYYFVAIVAHMIFKWLIFWIYTGGLMVLVTPWLYLIFMG